MPKLVQIQLPIGGDLQKALRAQCPQMTDFVLKKKSVDARGKIPFWNIAVEVYQGGEKRIPIEIQLQTLRPPRDFKPVIVVGSGPAGLFAALRLSERGIPCRLIERGDKAQKRILKIVRYWRHGELDPDNNVCFGEGGAGLYSDGKLITRIKSPHIAYVLNRLTQFGAPKEIEYLANPHVGSDRIRKVIPFIRQRLYDHGVQIDFNTKVTRLLMEKNQITGVENHRGEKIESSHVILATGHSCSEIFDHLHAVGVQLEGKSFALGLRIEHPQGFINRTQYGQYADHPDLGSANYRLSHHNHETEVGTYSFCMCPGGYVISSGTEPDGMVSNGMSNYARNSPFANAAVVVSMDHHKWFKEDIFGGMRFRKSLEQESLNLSVKWSDGKKMPAQSVTSFMARKTSAVTQSSSPSGVFAARLDKLIPEDLYRPLIEALKVFERKIPGFLSNQAQFHAIESRTSCPIRIPRDKETLESVSHHGLYPTGEGAGYAGGITSAAVDGVRVADAIFNQVSLKVGPNAPAN